jgi:hypothetical protein
MTRSVAQFLIPASRQLSSTSVCARVVTILISVQERVSTFADARQRALTSTDVRHGISPNSRQMHS